MNGVDLEQPLRSLSFQFLIVFIFVFVCLHFCSLIVGVFSIDTGFFTKYTLTFKCLKHDFTL